MRREFKKKQNRTILLVLGIIVGSLVLTSCKTNQAVGNDAGDEGTKSLLWEIQGNGIAPSYVYGTFHLLPQEAFNLTEKVTTAFDQSEQIVLELDMDDPNMQLEMMQNMAMTDGSTLDQLIGEEDLKLLDEQLQKEANLSVAQVNTFKPFMVETFLLPSFIEGTPASYEMTFVKRALDQQKEILGLETIQFQTSLFDQIPYEAQVEDLVEMLRDRTTMEEMFEEMITTYNEEDITELYNTSADYFSAQEIDLLLHKRNKDWIAKIGEMAKEKSTFFAVGAGHLGGDQGVISLLKAAGYEVTPVTKVKLASN